MNHRTQLMHYKTIQHFGLMVGASACIMCQVGCSGERGYKSQVSWGYVFDIGSAKKIGEWTLAQNDARKIADGISTLSSITVLRSDSEARHAVDAYVAVHRKIMEGWPGLVDSRSRKYPPGPPPLITLSRREAHATARQHPDDPQAQELYKRVCQIDPATEEETAGMEKEGGIFSGSNERKSRE
jgi:hypothetical protein